jgi:hypothetical protein
MSFSVANDEESHKLIYLEDVYRKMPGSSQYEKLDADGMLVDIADALTLQIKQVQTGFTDLPYHTLFRGLAALC